MERYILCSTLISITSTVFFVKRNERKCVKNIDICGTELMKQINEGKSQKQSLRPFLYEVSALL